jgi:hypothetical protein
MRELTLKYEKETKTVRSFPENYCFFELRTFGNGGSTDAALGDLDRLGRIIVERFNNGYQDEWASMSPLDRDAYIGIIPRTKTSAG